jgi:1,4-dihydroxy-2-naphthoyl-CoA hydrolase
MDTGASPPFAALIGFEIIDVMPERAAARMKIRPEFCNRNGVAAGGVLIALANTLGTVATKAKLRIGANTTTTESTTNFIASLLVGDIALAECKLVHDGEEMMVWQTKITRGDGRLAAVVTQTQLIRSSGLT